MTEHRHMDLLRPPGIDRLPRHRIRLEAACAAASEHEGVVGMIIGGSFASGEADAYSDLDLQLVVEEPAFDGVVSATPDIAAAAGPLVAAFTAEHVGRPHMLIALYSDLLHVDFEPVALPEVAARNAGIPAVVLWARDDRIDLALPAERPPFDPARELAWLEDRMWTWSWYIQSKILRGELYEALDALQFVRDRVLFGLLSLRDGHRPIGARRAEARVGAWAERFAATVPALSRESTLSALRTTVGLYTELADPLLDEHGIARSDTARDVVGRALDTGLDWRPAQSGPRP
jgi:hypothetical protein